MGHNGAFLGSHTTWTAGHPPDIEIPAALPTAATGTSAAGEASLPVTGPGVPALGSSCPRPHSTDTNEADTHVAAVLRRRSLDDVTEDDWNLQMDINLKASFFLNRETRNAMVAGGGGGRIINFASMAWLVGPLLGSDAYVISKAGIVSMTRGFARAIGPHGILVNTVSSGQIDTPMQHRDNTPEVMEGAMSMCPLGRMGRPEEAAAVVLFLASRHASFVNGATINVSGGLIMY